jgi:hypothetical protein
MNRESITEITAFLLGSSVREDLLSVGFQKACHDARSITGYIGPFDSLPYKPKNVDLPTVFFVSSSGSEELSMCFVVPDRDEGFGPRWLSFVTSPSNPEYRDCLAHADYFMRGCCSPLIYLESSIQAPAGKSGFIKTNSLKFANGSEHSFFGSGSSVATTLAFRTRGRWSSQANCSRTSGRCRASLLSH